MSTICDFSYAAYYVVELALISLYSLRDIKFESANLSTRSVITFKSGETNDVKTKNNEW
jgi:hypothetical protein